MLCIILPVILFYSFFRPTIENGRFYAVTVKLHIQTTVQKNMYRRLDYLVLGINIAR